MASSSRCDSRAGRRCSTRSQYLRSGARRTRLSRAARDRPKAIVPWRIPGTDSGSLDPPGSRPPAGRCARRGRPSGFRDGLIERYGGDYDLNPPGKAVSIHEGVYPALRLDARLGFSVTEDKGICLLLERRARYVNTASSRSAAIGTRKSSIAPRRSCCTAARPRGCRSVERPVRRTGAAASPGDSDPPHADDGHSDRCLRSRRRIRPCAQRQGWRRREI